MTQDQTVQYQIDLPPPREKPGYRLFHDTGSLKLSIATGTLFGKSSLNTSVIPPPEMSTATVSRSLLYNSVVIRGTGPSLRGVVLGDSCLGESSRIP